MEIFILIPIIAVIYGWMHTIPSQPAPPEGVNGVAFGNGFCSDYVPNDESLFTDDDDTFSTGMNFDDDMNSDSGMSINDDICRFDQPDMLHEMMFNPINSWCDFNIFHTDDAFHDIGITSAFDDQFSSGISSTFHSFDD